MSPASSSKDSGRVEGERLGALSRRRLGWRLVEADSGQGPSRWGTAIDPVKTVLRVGDDDRCQFATAPGAGEHRGVGTSHPAEPVGVLTSLTGNGVLGAAEEQDCLRVGVAKVDLARGAGNRNPSIAPKLRIRVGPDPPIALAPLRSMSAGLHSPVGETAVDDHLHRVIFPKRLAQRPARVLSGSRDHDDQGALAVLHTGSPLVRVNLTPRVRGNQQEVSAVDQPAHARWTVPPTRQSTADCLPIQRPRPSRIVPESAWLAGRPARSSGNRRSPRTTLPPGGEPGAGDDRPLLAVVPGGTRARQEAPHGAGDRGAARPYADHLAEARRRRGGAEGPYSRVLIRSTASSVCGREPNAVRRK